jgi:hypothetical protein
MHINSSSKRRNSFCESGSASSQAAVSELLGYALLSLYSLDQTAHFLVAARITRRSWQKQVSAQSGKCPFTKTSHHSPSAGETTSMHQGRSNASCITGRVGSHLAAGSLYCSTRDTAAVASGPLSPGLETQISGRFSYTEGSCRNYCIDQGDGSEESASSALSVSVGNC